MAHIGNFCDRSISRDSRRSTIANSFIPNRSPSVAPVNFIQTERPRTNFSTRPPKLTANTHAKFIKSIRLEFPKYSSESEPVYWIRQVEHFFYCYGIEYEDHVMMATFYLTGQAQIWYQLFYDEEGDLNWEEFCDRLYKRFGPFELDNFMGDLVKLYTRESRRGYVFHLMKNSNLDISARGYSY